ncbi:MAG: DUF523 domain-containing protein [Mariprofundaceae bacterium]
MKKVLISACLLGERVRYDGGCCNCISPWLRKLQKQGRAVAFCPEVAGGLAVPRAAAELQDGDAMSVLTGRSRIMTELGIDVTASFLQGAEYALQLCKENSIRLAILKDHSPSCGTTQIHDGRFTGQKVPGMGITATQLHRHGIRVFNEKNIKDAQSYDLEVHK